MSQFIKLTSLIINKNLISCIYTKQNKYCIFVNVYETNALIFWNGVVRTDKIEVCEKNDPEDYKIISNWIDTIDDNK